MEKKTRGRKTIMANERTVSITVKMGESQRTKWHKLGGSAWMRARIDRAKIKGE